MSACRRETLGSARTTSELSVRPIRVHLRCSGAARRLPASSKASAGYVVLEAAELVEPRRRAHRLDRGGIDVGVLEKRRPAEARAAAGGAARDVVGVAESGGREAVATLDAAQRAHRCERLGALAGAMEFGEECGVSKVMAATRLVPMLTSKASWFQVYGSDPSANSGKSGGARIESRRRWAPLQSPSQWTRHESGRSRSWRISPTARRSWASSSRSTGCSRSSRSASALPRASGSAARACGWRP